MEKDRKLVRLLPPGMIEPWEREMERSHAEPRGRMTAQTSQTASDTVRRGSRGHSRPRLHVVFWFFKIIWDKLP